MSATRVTRRQLLRSAGLGVAGLALGACQPQVIEKVVKETVVVEKRVAETVVVKEAVEVEKEVTRVVEKAVEAPKEMVEIRWHAFAGPYGDWSTKRAGEFSAASDTITVKVEAFPSDGYRAKLRSMFASKLIGDAFWHWDVTAWLAEWAHLGMSLPVDDLIDAEGFDLDVYYKSALEGATFKGQLMGLPLHTHATQSIMLYNQGMMDEIGQAYPDTETEWSLDELIEVAKKITVSDGGKIQRYGWLPLTSWDPMNVWSRAFGGDLVSTDGTKALLTSPEVKALVQFHVDAMYKHEVTPKPEAIETSNQAMFASEKVGIIQAGSSWPPSIRKTVKDRFKWATVLLPEGPEPKGTRGALSATHVGAICPVSKNPEATWAFLKFMSTRESGIDKVLFGAGAPGARPDCYNDPKLLAQAPEYAVVGRALDSAGTENVPANLRGTELSRTFSNEMANIWLGEVGVDEGLEQVNASLQAVLDKPIA